MKSLHSIFELKIYEPLVIFQQYVCIIYIINGFSWIEMGPRQSTAHNYGVVREENIYHFEKVQILRQLNGGSQFFIQIYEFLISPDIEEAFIRSLKKRNNQCPYLIQMKQIQLEPGTKCSNASRIKVVFQYFPSTLQTLIDRGHNFTEKEIIRIFTCLLQAIKHLNSHESHHGDISPQFIYIDFKNHQATFKIFDSAYFKQKRNGYYRAQQQKVFCAPQILTNLGDKRLYPIYNHEIADTFSIGLIILYCMTLVSPLGAYNKKNQIDTYFIQSMFRIAHRKQYNQKIIQIVRECLKYRNRPNASEVLNRYAYVFDYTRQNSYQNTSTKVSLKKSRIVHRLL